MNIIAEISANNPSRHSCRFTDDLPIEEVHGTGGVVGVTSVVGDHANGGALCVEILEKVHDRFAVLGIQVSGRLVGEEDAWTAGQGAGDCNALLLAPGKLAGQVLHAGTMSTFSSASVASFLRSLSFPGK